MFFHDILPPSKIPTPPVYFRNKAEEMRDISKKSIYNITEKEYEILLTLIRRAAENGCTNYTTFRVKGDVDEIIKNLKHDGFDVDNLLHTEYPHLTISW